jgi:predicted PurR-regulated permease PerM
MNIRTQKIFFVSLFLGAFALLAYIFSPFFAVILLGVVAGIALEPLFLWVQRVLKLGPSLASLFSVFVVLLVIFATTSLVGTQLANQAQSVYQNVVSGNQYQIDDVSDYINNIIRPFNDSYEIDLQKYISPVISFVAQNVGGIVSGTASVIFKFFLWLVTLYFVLKDGRKIKKMLTKLSPLEDIHDNKLFQHVAASARSIVRGVFFVAIIQGFFVGLGLWFVGIENAIFWGLVAAIAAPIPLLGTSVIMIPSIAYLLITSQFVPALILTVWGVTAVGLIDNVLTPYFYSKGTEIHPLILLFSILGGLTVFGPIGFIVGPLIATITLTLTSLYQEIVLEEKSKA